MRALREMAGIVPALAAIIVLAAACKSTEPSDVSPQHETTKRGHFMVRIMDASLHPGTLTIDAGATVSWSSYTTSRIAAVQFETEVIEALGCGPDLRPNWLKVAGGTRSVPITQGVSDIELPCKLEAGEWDYEVLLGNARGGGLNNPEVVLPGKLIVE